MLLVWAKAVLFADINQFSVVAPNWSTPKIGPYLRREKDKRYYGHLFSNQIYVPQRDYWIANFRRKIVFHNPDITVIDTDLLRSPGLEIYLFIFDLLPHWSDYFADIKQHPTLIKEKLLNSIRPSVLDAMHQRPSPEIGVHVRMGDFRVLPPGAEFAKIGQARTPLSWYVEVIQSIRETVGYNVPVTLFSDGAADELEMLLKLSHVSLAPPASALSDMLTLSRSKILVAAASSTFSGWASYLGQCPTIWHPAHFHAGVLSDSVSQHVFEGGFDPGSMAMSSLLTQNIQSIFKIDD